MRIFPFLIWFPPVVIVGRLLNLFLWCFPFLLKHLCLPVVVARQLRRGLGPKTDDVKVRLPVIHQPTYGRYMGVSAHTQTQRMKLNTHRHACMNIHLLFTFFLTRQYFPSPLPLLLPLCPRLVHPPPPPPAPSLL